MARVRAANFTEMDGIIALKLATFMIIHSSIIVILAVLQWSPSKMDIIVEVKKGVLFSAINSNAFFTNVLYIMLSLIQECPF